MSAPKRAKTSRNSYVHVNDDWLLAAVWRGDEKRGWFRMGITAITGLSGLLRKFDLGR